MPLASQIKGLAQLQQNAGTSRLFAAKACHREQVRSSRACLRRPCAASRSRVLAGPWRWRRAAWPSLQPDHSPESPESPESRESRESESGSQEMFKVRANATNATHINTYAIIMQCMHETAGNASPSQMRGSTCPPLRRKSTLEARLLSARLGHACGARLRPVNPPWATCAAPHAACCEHMVSLYRSGSTSESLGAQKCSFICYFYIFVFSLSLSLSLAHLSSFPLPKCPRLDKNVGARDKSRARARSEHSRLGRIGRSLVTPGR